jgi:hypothetical protein
VDTQADCLPLRGEDLLCLFKAARRRAARAANSAPTLRSRCRSPLRAGRRRLDRRGEQGTLGPLRRQTVRRGMVLAVAWTVAPGGLVPPAGHSGSGMGPESRSVSWWLGWKPVHPARRRPRTSRAEPPAVAKVVQSWSAPPSPPPAAPLPDGVGRRWTGWPGAGDDCKVGCLDHSVRSYRLINNSARDPCRLTTIENSQYVLRMLWLKNPFNALVPSKI